MKPLSSHLYEYIVCSLFSLVNKFIILIHVFATFFFVRKEVWKGFWWNETNGTPKRMGEFHLPYKESMCTNPGIEFSDRTKLLLMWGPVYFINTMFTMERIQNEHGFQQCFASTGGVLVKEWGRVNSLIPGCDNSRD